MITFEDFQKLDIKIGTITAAEAIEDADSLLKLTIDCGEEEPRTIVAGVKDKIDDIDMLTGKQVPVLVNLESKEMFGVESNGMMLVVSEHEVFSLLSPQEEVPVGTSVQ